MHLILVALTKFKKKNAYKGNNLTSYGRSTNPYRLATTFGHPLGKAAKWGTRVVYRQVDPRKRAFSWDSLG